MTIPPRIKGWVEKGTLTNAFSSDRLCCSGLEDVTPLLSRDLGSPGSAQSRCAGGGWWIRDFSSPPRRARAAPLPMESPRRHWLCRRVPRSHADPRHALPGHPHASVARARCWEPLLGQASALPEDLSPQMAHMCLVKEAIVPEGCAGTLRTPLSPRGGLMSSELLTGFMGELSCQDRSTVLSGELWMWGRASSTAGLARVLRCGAGWPSRGQGSNGDKYRLKHQRTKLNQEEDLGT